jgi:hypothetical protein
MALRKQQIIIPMCVADGTCERCQQKVPGYQESAFAMPMNSTCSHLESRIASHRTMLFALAGCWCCPLHEWLERGSFASWGAPMPAFARFPCISRMGFQSQRGLANHISPRRQLASKQLGLVVQGQKCMGIFPSKLHRRSLPALLLPSPPLPLACSITPIACTEYK